MNLHVQYIKLLCHILKLNNQCHFICYCAKTNNCFQFKVQYIISCEFNTCQISREMNHSQKLSTTASISSVIKITIWQATEQTVGYCLSFKKKKKNKKQ